MKINVITTIEYEKEGVLTEEDLGKIYDEFRSILKNAYESKDITDFSFVDTDTTSEIESLVEG